jgi:predicted permease
MVQATLSVVLVAAATMLAHSLVNLERQDFGYRTEGQVLVGLSGLPSTPERLSSVYRDIEQRLARLSGVHGVGLAGYNPLQGWASLNTTIRVAGHPPNPSGEAGAASDRVSSDYLQNLGIELVRGRLFTTLDNENGDPVAIVNESFAKRFFKENENPIGQHFSMAVAENADALRIVGIVRDAKFSSLGLSRPPPAMFFTPLEQSFESKSGQGNARPTERLTDFIGGILLVTDWPPGDLDPVLRKTLAEADPNLTVMSVRTIEEQIELSANQERAVTTLAGLFGMVALVLAGVGVYSVTAYMVTQQTNEIGIRMALGADRPKVIGLVLWQTFIRVAIGLVMGLPLAVGAASLMGAQLYGVLFWDPLALGIAAGSLIVFTFLAAIIPAGHAGTTCPMNALRSE